MNNIALFFGSFNPIHIGHLIIANTVLQEEKIHEVWFIVSPQNPFKKSKNLLHEFDRLRLVELAIHKNYQFRVSDIEFSMPKPSYTIDTLTYLSERNKQKRFHLIIGEDNLDKFPKWKNYQIILENYGLIVYPRPKVTQSVLKRHPNVTLVDAPLLDISATFIRKQISVGKSISYLVPEAVELEIKSNKYFL